MILEAPINPLSIGQVSYNFARELFKKGELDGFFPVGNCDFAAYEPTGAFKDILKDLSAKSLQNLKRSDSALKCWHLNGSEKTLTDNNYLYTFYEVDAPTPEEISIVKRQNHVFFSSREAAKCFEKAGCENVSYVPLGFDEDFNEGIVRKNEDKIHFILVGKFEQRKNTQQIIKCWLENYGNNNDYQLSCLINNPFLKEESYEQIIQSFVGAESWSNINFLPPLKTNIEMSMLHKSADIDLSGCCFNEGWGLPAFNSACLGNVCVVGDKGGHSDWMSFGESDNIVPISPSGKYPCYDGMFFHEGQPFNQGSFYKVESDELLRGMSDAVELVQARRAFGEDKFDRTDLQKHFSYQNSIGQMIKVMNENH